MTIRRERLRPRLPVALLVAAVTCLTAALAVGAQSAAAQSDPEGVSPQEVAAIARELNCPICQGYNLQDCPLEVCAQMRDLIREKLADGQTPEQIRAAFVDEYGPQVLNAPPTEGVFLSAWIAPVLVMLGGLVVLALFVVRGRRRATRRQGAGAQGPGTVSTSGPTTTGAGRTAERQDEVLGNVDDYAGRLEQMLEDEK